MLKAPLSTRLWARLRQENRVLSIAKIKGKLGHPRSYTNIVPKLMTRLELMQGYRSLLERVYRWENFSKRIFGFVSLVRRPLKTWSATPSLEDLKGLSSRLNEGAEGKKAIDEMIDFTNKKAPWMLATVRSLIVQHSDYLRTLDKLLPQIDRQIELESSGQLVLEPDKSPIHIPPSFRRSFNDMFLRAYQRMAVNLEDQSNLPEALSEVFFDFLMRFGQDFRELETYHQLVIDEICDRVCAKFNGQPPEEFLPNEVSDAHGPNVKRVGLADDIINTVEQMLIKQAGLFK